MIREVFSFAFRHLAAFGPDKASLSSMHLSGEPLTKLDFRSSRNVTKTLKFNLGWYLWKINFILGTVVPDICLLRPK